MRSGSLSLVRNISGLFISTIVVIIGLGVASIALIYRMTVEGLIRDSCGGVRLTALAAKVQGDGHPFQNGEAKPVVLKIQSL